MPEPTPPSRRKLTGVCPPARGAVLAALWFALAVLVFHRGLRRYASASS